VRLHSKRFRLLPAAACLAAAVIMLTSAGPAAAQDNGKYHTYAEMTALLRSLADAHKGISRLASIGKTAGGRDIWALEIADPAGTPVKERPALLVAANFEADHLVGSEIALAVADALLKGYPGDSEVKNRLENSVVYIIPRLNPDGAEGMFAAVKSGLRTNLAPRDDDNDGRLDEDGPEDLNKDGYITLMRVKAPDGEYMVDPEEPRLMKKADPKKGESGAYKIYWEGIDRDKDGFIAEDPVGGTDLNRNFMHAYPYYQPDAGRYMVSENESRALMDWIIAHRNVAAILTFGESDNLIAPPAGGRPGSSREIDLIRFADAGNAAARTVGMIQTGGLFGFRRFGGMEFSFEMMGEFLRQGRRQSQAPAEEGRRFRMPDRKAPTAVLPADQDYFRTIAAKYGELTGLRQPLYVREPEGAFYEVGYFQLGLPSFSTPGFGLTAQDAGGPRPKGAAAGPSGPPGAAQWRQETASGETVAMRIPAGGQARMQMIQAGGPRMGQGAGETAAAGVDAQLLKWMDAEKIDGFVKWTKFTHPDLGEVEIGGFKPYAAVDPPAAALAGLGASHLKFVLYLTSLFPKVKVASTEVTNHGGGIFGIKAEVENTGFLPTASSQAVTARAVKPVLVQLGVAPEDVISGSAKTNFIPVLDGSGGRAKYEWIIRGKSGAVIELKVAAEKGGSDTARITLK
jgi:hypothetical protein